MVLGVGLIVSLYSKLPVREETPGKEPLFYVLFLLQITGLAGICLTGDAFNLYVLIEVAALTGYGLIAMGTNRAAATPLSYPRNHRASFTCSEWVIYIKTGTLNMVGVQEVIQANGLMDSPSMQVAFALIGLGISSRWLSSLSRLAAQCLQRPDHHFLFAGSLGDQGDDLR